MARIVADTMGAVLVAFYYFTDVPPGRLVVDRLPVLAWRIEHQGGDDYVARPVVVHELPAVYCVEFCDRRRGLEMWVFQDEDMYGSYEEACVAGAKKAGQPTESRA